jgi:hypothetical protein
MEQILARLLAEMNVMHGRTEARIGAEIKTILEKMDSDQEKAEACYKEMEENMSDGQGEVKAQMV